MIINTATTSMYGLVPRTAEYRDGIGCVLINGDDDYKVRFQSENTSEPTDLYWPLGSMVSKQKVSGVDYDMLDNAVNAAF